MFSLKHSDVIRRYTNYSMCDPVCDVVQLVCVSRNAPPPKWPTLCRVGRWTLLTRCHMGAISYVDISIRLALFRLDKLWNQLVYLLDKTSCAFVSLPSCLCRFFRWGLFFTPVYPYVVYPLPATGNRSPRIICRQSLWLAGMWHAAELQATGRSQICYQDGVDV